MREDISKVQDGGVCLEEGGYKLFDVDAVMRGIAAENE